MLEKETAGKRRYDSNQRSVSTRKDTRRVRNHSNHMNKEHQIIGRKRWEKV